MSLAGRARSVALLAFALCGLATTLTWRNTASAQGTPRDTVTQSRPVRDSTARDTSDRKVLPGYRPARPDSIQARIGRGDVLPSIEIGESYTFDRDALFRSGALTLGDLLDRLPGISAFRTGWLASPQTVAYGGDFSRTRLFVDGVEWDDLQARNGAAPDVHSFPISVLERLTLVRTASELRVDLRTWEYNLTDPYTRIDVLTGDLNTNLYRVFYGKRFYNGAGFQLAGQQYGVTDTRYGGGGDQFTVLGRYGVARRLWSLDATAIRTNNTRTITRRFDGGQFLPGYRSANTLAYLRAAIGQEGSGPFLQLLASTQILKENSSHLTAAAAVPYAVVADTADTLASSTQYVATAGFDRYGGRIRLVERYRRRLGRGYNSPSATFDLTTGPLAVNALAERDEYAGLTRLEAGGRLMPLPFVAVLGYIGTRTAFGDPAPEHIRQPSSRSARLEGGLRLYSGGPWVTAGVVTRDTALLIPPAVFDSAFVAVPVGRQTGTTATLRGPLAYGFSVDLTGVRWQHPGPYTPEYQAHGELRYFTQWLSRFPSGDFSFLVQPMLDYRTAVLFPELSFDRVTGPSKAYSVLVELRILRAVLTYQRRNLTALNYQQVPGFFLPRPLNVYGVRWYFFD